MLRLPGTAFWIRSLFCWTKVPLGMLFLLVVPAAAFGVPQQPLETSSNELLYRVAPESCWAFSAWSNQSRPDADSENHTDRLMAEPEVQRFLQQLQDRVEQLIPAVVGQGDPDKSAMAEVVAQQLIRGLFRKSGCFFVENLTLQGEEALPLVEAMLLVEVGSSSEEVAQSLVGLVAGDGQAPESITIEGQAFFEVPLDEFRIWIGHSGPWLMVGSGGSEPIARALKRLKGTEKPEWLVALDQRQPLERCSTLTYLNVKKLRETFLPLLGEEVIQIAGAMGWDNVLSIESKTGLNRTESVSRTLLRFDGQPRGMFALFSDMGIPFETLQQFPEDSLFAIAFDLDLARTLAFGQRLMLRFSPREALDVTEGLAEFQRETGVDLQGDLLEQLGPTWTLHNGAGDGWVSGMVMTASIKDGPRFAEAIEKLEAMLAEVASQFDDAPRISRQEEAGVVVRKIRFPELPLPVEPSWMIRGNRLYVALYPQTLIPIAREMNYPRLIESPSIEEYLSEGTDGGNALLGFFYQDSQKQFELTYPYAQMFFSMGRNLLTDLGDLPPEFAGAMESTLSGVDLPSSRSIHRHLIPTRTVIRRVADGYEVETRQTIPTLDVTFAAPVGVALLLPAVQQVRMAARRTQSMNNLRMQILALHNYESSYRRFPAGYSTDESGEPLLSWRVHILPYLEEQALYEQFHLDEPWDSPHNLKLVDRMPEFLRSPVSNSPPGTTTYRGVGGQSGLLRGPDRPGNQGIRFAQIVDGTSNTLFIVETSDDLAVVWTRPDTGLDPEDLDPAGLFGAYPGGTNAGMADGSVRFISDMTDFEILKQLMKMDDGGPAWGWDMEDDGHSDIEKPEFIEEAPVGELERAGGG